MDDPSACVGLHILHFCPFELIDFITWPNSFRPTNQVFLINLVPDLVQSGIACMQVRLRHNAQYTQHATESDELMNGAKGTAVCR